MAPIDYSKWDNIDTDSEGENFPPKTAAPKVKMAAVLAASSLVEPAFMGVISALEIVQAVIV